MADARILRAGCLTKALCNNTQGGVIRDPLASSGYLLVRGNARARTRAQHLLTVLVAMLVSFSHSARLLAVTPESPEVRKLITAGLESLEGHSEERLGGLCLIALAFIKDGASPDNHHVQAAIKACQKTSAQQVRMENVYSNGLAIIFLVELDPVKYKDLINRFAGSLANRQKNIGAWGYESYKTGDTSQTQYAALCTWELWRVGMAPQVKKIESCTNWLLRTQDPSGAWGYQGKDPGSFDLIKQKDVSLSMHAAGLGSTMIFGNVLGLAQPGKGTEVEENLADTPAALKQTNTQKKKSAPALKGNGVDRKRLMKAISLGQAWYDKHFKANLISESEYPNYVLYSMERYKSFEELLIGVENEEPQWYQDGYKYLKKKQLKEGGWNGREGKPCATAFSVLFLLRSTQKSIKANLGQGTLIGGRGLSSNLSRMKLRRGRLVTEEKPTDIDNFLSLLDGDNSESLEALMNDPTALQVKNVGPEEARRLQQLAKSGKPPGRVLAVHALARMRNLDYVPTLLFAMTDPDRRVVREARDGLRYVSRRFEGYGLTDNYTESERFHVLDKWKQWYRRVRPNAPPLP